MFNRSAKDKVKDIRRKDINKSVSIKSKNVQFQVKGALVGTVSDEEVFLDEELLNARIEKIGNAILNTCSKYSEIPEKIVLINEESKSEKTENKENQVSKYTLIEPKTRFDDVYLDEENKEVIMNTLAIEKYREKLFETWNLGQAKDKERAICLNFYGKPGTGKSLMCQAIGNYLDKKILFVNYSELESKYVGETPKNIKEVFKIAQEKNAVIVFDEADSFLGKRLTNVSQAADYGVNIARSVMLIELEKFNGVVIFTTNLMENYDEAFRRRILCNIEFKMPDEEGRKQIWEKNLPKELPLEEDINSSALAKNFEEITGADIRDIVILAAVKALNEKREVLRMKDFENAYKAVKSRYIEEQKVIVKKERITAEEYNKEIEGNCHA
ncbi:MAG: ATP-binding protein [Clostridium sp.]